MPLFENAGIKSKVPAEKPHYDTPKTTSYEVYGKIVISDIMPRHTLTNTIAKISNDTLTTASTSRPIN